ncbi:ABC transporter substrate-binding protein [Streptomyces varsoviensis]|uniref:ABC transporter substrate-binding protein n=1 Tax=Streptomyces varsoviensis TaxID=67373 RepID=UPI0033E666FF
MRTARTAPAVVTAVALGLVGLVGPAGLTGCGGPSAAGSRPQPGDTPAEGRTFTMAMPADPGTLDPALTVLSAAIQVGRFLYDPLIQVTADGRARAGLAEKWEGDATTARFRMRPGVTCSDGTPLTARDVAANIAFVADPTNRSPLTGLYVNPGTTATVDAANREVTVVSKVPDAFLTRNVGMVPIVCGKGLEDRAALAEGRYGTGMFTLTEAVPGDHYTLTRRKDYVWGPGDWRAGQKGLPDKVRIRIVPNETTAANLLLSGELNAANLLGPDQQRLFGRGQYHADATAALGEMWFNQAPGRPGQDETTRRALARAVDLPVIGKVLSSGTGKPSGGLISIEPKTCTDATAARALPSHDVAAAKSLLGEAGWREGPGGVRAKDGKRLRIALLYPSQIGQPAASAAELIQKAWQAVGAEVTLRGVDNPGLNQIVGGTASWDAAVLPLGLAMPPQLRPFVSGPTPPNGTNFAHIDNKDYVSLATAAARMPGTEGCPTWNRAESALIEAVDVLPFVDAVQPTFGAGARFEKSYGSITPSSIRMFKE